MRCRPAVQADAAARLAGPDQPILSSSSAPPLSTRSPAPKSPAPPVPPPPLRPPPPPPPPPTQNTHPLDVHGLHAWQQRADAVPAANVQDAAPAALQALFGHHDGPHSVLVAACVGGGEVATQSNCTNTTNTHRQARNQQPGPAAAPSPGPHLFRAASPATGRRPPCPAPHTNLGRYLRRLAWAPPRAGVWAALRSG